MPKEAGWNTEPHTCSNCLHGVDDREWKYSMLPDTPSVAQLSQVISQVTAPAFLLGAVAAFISLLISRMNRIIDRSQALNEIGNDDAKARLKGDIPRMKRRAQLLNNAIFFASLCAIVTTLLIIVAFTSAFLNLPHEHGVGALFIVALVFFAVSMVNLAREARISLHEFDHFK
jgi:magnesium-transporting ATPase (P-type)